MVNQVQGINTVSLTFGWGCASVLGAFSFGVGLSLMRSLIAVSPSKSTGTETLIPPMSLVKPVVD